MKQRELILSSAALLLVSVYILGEIQTLQQEPLIPYDGLIKIGATTFSGFVTILLIKSLNRDKWSTILLISIISFILVAILSSSWSEEPLLVLGRCGLALGPLGVAVVLTHLSTQPDELFTRVAYISIIFGVVISIIGISLYVFGKTMDTSIGRIQYLSIGPYVLSHRLYGIPPILRVSSVVGNPNTLAASLFITITFSISLILSSKIRVMATLALLPQIGALGLTYSRTGIGTTIITVILLVIISYTGRISRPTFSVNWRWIAAGIGVCLIIIGGVGMHLWSTIPPYSVYILQLSSIIPDRIQIWSTLATSIASNPVRGVGFGVANEIILQPAGLEFAPHNAHIATLAEVGVVGFIPYLGIWIAGIASGIRNIVRLRDKRKIILVATSVSLIIGFGIHGFAEGSVMRPHWRQVIWAFCLGYASYPHSPSPVRRKIR